MFHAISRDRLRTLKRWREGLVCLSLWTCMFFCCIFVYMRRIFAEADEGVKRSSDAGKWWRRYASVIHVGARDRLSRREFTWQRLLWHDPALVYNLSPLATTSYTFSLLPPQPCQISRSRATPSSSPGPEEDWAKRAHISTASARHGVMTSPTVTRCCSLREAQTSS